MPISTRLSHFLDESHVTFTYELNGLALNSENPLYEKTHSFISFNAIPEKPFDLIFSISFDIEKLKLACPNSETSSIESIFEVIVEMQSFTSRKTEIISLAQDSENISLDSTCYYEGQMTIDPNDWIGELTFKGFIVRSKDVVSEPLYLTKIGHVLGQSPQQKIYLDSYSEQDGSGDLDVRIDSTVFESDEMNILYKLIESDRVVAINGGNDPELNTLFTSKTKSGLLLNTKRALFAPIAADITEQLARKAFAKMLNDDYENPTVIALESTDFPYASVADDVARALSPGAEIDDALDHLVNLLESNDTRDQLINIKLPLIVQHISKRSIKDCYKSAAKDAIERNHNRVLANDQNS